MAYGLIARLVAKPGQRDTVLARLSAAARNLDGLGCRQYVVGAARADDVTIWISEVWDSEQHHRNSLEHSATRDAINQTMPLLTGEFVHHELDVS